MARFDAQGTCACECGKTHRIEARSVLVSTGAIEESAELLRRTRGAGVRLWVLSDENTEAAAGTRFKSAIRTARTESRVLPGRPKPHPTTSLVDQLAGDVKQAGPDLLVAVGSGVVSDLVKRLSLTLGLPNWCVATAPSVDAFTSGTAAITFNGFHGSLPARAAEVVVCDLDVMERAPREMHLAGLGDLLAKFLAHLDWKLSRTVTGETYCPFVGGAALESARSALTAARRLGRDPGEAARTLTDAALTSGFAMQALGGSRSAASAEHTMAHFWETTHAVHNGRYELHGILTGAASRIMLHAYRAFYARLDSFLLDDGERLRRFDGEPPWSQTVEEGLRPFMVKVNAEMAERDLNRGALARRLEAFRIGRQEIASAAAAMLDELAAAVDLLKGIGFPFAPRELEIDRESVRLPLRNIRLLRGRYSTFDLAYDLGLEGDLCAGGERLLSAGE